MRWPENVNEAMDICVLKVYTYVATHMKGACQAVFTCGQIVAASCAAVKHLCCHVELAHA